MRTGRRAGPAPGADVAVEVELDLNEAAFGVTTEVEVEVTRMEPGNPSSPDKAKHKERFTLSLRARQEDPWKAVLAEVKEGDRLTRKVARLQPFGAFVEIRPGVDGLIHISALSDRRIAHPKDVVKVGQEEQVEVQKVDPAEKRIGLRLVREGEEAAPPVERKAAEPKVEGPRPRVGAVVKGRHGVGRHGRRDV